jgi:hypothetical protein
MKTIKAVRSFTGREGFWKRGAQNEVADDRAADLIRKGLAVEVDAEGNEVQAEDSSADAKVTRRTSRRADKMAPAPTTREPKPTETKPANPDKREPAPLETKPGKAEHPVTFADGVITVPAQTFGEGDAELTIAAASHVPDAAGDYSVFAFPDGSTVFASGDAVAETAAKDGATFLDLIRVEEADLGKGPAGSQTGEAEQSSSSRPAPQRGTKKATSKSSKAAKASS